MFILYLLQYMSTVLSTPPDSVVNIQPWWYEDIMLF